MPSLDGPSQTLPTLYQIYNDPSRYANDFHDITAGSNGYSAAIGYDLLTGMGTPKANALLADLACPSPMVIGTTPSLSGGTLAAGSTTLAVNFNMPVVGADNPANYELQSVGPDGLLGTADDQIVSLSASFSGTTATLTFPALAESVYRFTVRDTITDVLGSTLDGGNWTVDFVSVPTSPPPVTLSSPHSLPFDMAVGALAGELIQGYNNAFDGDGRLISAERPISPLAGLHDRRYGQTVATNGRHTGRADRQPQITVPNTGGQDFARTIDTFTNSTGSAITTSVNIVGNLGSDAATNVFATSDGSGIVSPNDQWIGTDDASDGSGTPAVIHFIHGPGHAVHRFQS